MCVHKGIADLMISPSMTHSSTKGCKVFLFMNICTIQLEWNNAHIMLPFCPIPQETTTRNGLKMNLKYDKLHYAV